MDGPYVYLLIEREFINLRNPTLKIGKSDNVRRRVTQYPNGSLTLGIMPVHDAKVAEDNLKVMFAAAFTWRKDIGLEYFMPPGEYEQACDDARRLFYMACARHVRYVPAVESDDSVAPEANLDVVTAPNALDAEARDQAVFNEDVDGDDAPSIGTNVTAATDSLTRLEVKVAPAPAEPSVAELIIDLALDLVARIRLAPSMRSSNCNGIFVCDAHTGVWASCQNSEVERMLLDALKRDVLRRRLSAADVRHAESRRGSADILHCVSRHCTEKGFRDRLDANLDLFAVRNGVFDMTTKAFRATRPDDYVQTTTGWEYDPAKAAEHRPALEKFLATVVPIAEERDVMLAYFASLMSGRRRVDKFMVLRDRSTGERSGTGASTLLRLMERFFGAYVHKDCAALLSGSCKAAALESLRGKRLLLAADVGAATRLNAAALERYTAGESVAITGTPGGRSAEPFSFVLEAGVVLVFRELDFPEFNDVLAERALVVPMGSRLVPSLEASSSDYPQREHTFVLDQDAVSRTMVAWMPALAEVLLQHYGRLDACCAALPASMKEWSSVVVAASNLLSGWLDRHVEVTQARADYLVLGALEEQHKQHQQHDTGMPQLKHGDFKRYVWTYMTQHGATCINGVSHVGGSMPSAKNVIRGVRWRKHVCSRGNASHGLLRAFVALKADNEECIVHGRRVYLEAVQGVSTSIKFIRRAFQEWTQVHRREGAGRSDAEKVDENSLQALGYTVDDNVNVCKSCGMHAVLPLRCCAQYVGTQRSKCKAVRNVRLTTVEVAT